jgi:uncharacterized membrane protein YfcA
MQIYLPIAEMSVDVLLLLGLGAAVGFLSGMFGVGGGFLMTPLLIFVGVPPPIAVASEANHITASVSGVLAHWLRKGVDFKMGLYLLIGGMAGSSAGVWLFGILSERGQIDLAISLLYVIFLGIVGILMAQESVRTIRRRRRNAAPAKRIRQPRWIRSLPLKVRFHKSRLYISAFLPIGVGALVGVLAGLLGVGGGFILVPAMIYLIGMPSSVVIGTSLFQVVFVTANVTFLQSVQHQTVDVVLAFFLLLGGVIGAQYGARVGARLPGEQMRGLLALLVLAVAIKLLLDLVITPDDLYSLQVTGAAK